VIYVPDKDKGNDLKNSPAGLVGTDGTYTLSTAGKEGAPPGWYKVTVTTRYPGAPANAAPIAVEYADFRKTTLKVEVIASPAAGAYDLHLHDDMGKPGP
jgi:hypothetical protein